MATDFESLTSDGYSARGVLARSPVVQEVASLLATTACELLGAEAQATKATYFDKTPDSNWLVPWHQDLTITVTERLDLEGFTHWRAKEGLWHVQPPLEVLTKTVALRVHIDPCRSDNGALRVIPGSHSHGVLDERAIDDLSTGDAAVDLEVDRGDLISMAPLLLHSSRRADLPRHSAEQFLKHNGCEVILQKPTKGNWAKNKNMFVRITGWKGRSNEDTTRNTR